MIWFVVLILRYTSCTNTAFSFIASKQHMDGGYTLYCLLFATSTSVIADMWYRSVMILGFGQGIFILVVRWIGYACCYCLLLAILFKKIIKDRPISSIFNAWQLYICFNELAYYMCHLNMFWPIYPHYYLFGNLFFVSFFDDLPF